ncbi:flagellar export chaperone FliS [Paenibacillus albicereus]|uniref:Flagellar secretion chaperone FliS n=1 Tax=Paenibacillus albicereus TaxID=2726185 RepID=A0A6H2H259_9BACL|nr:flagellar export chaperone FliS [Paenibacillus albicereus]QJC53771.1 flagellar export chaperone FliS [Paenibacillus albicereus]
MLYSPYQTYQQRSAETATPIQLVLMLYDGAIRFTRQGMEATAIQNYEQANLGYCKAEAIVNELMASLNFSYPISKDLVRIYEYVLHQLIQANVYKKTAPAEEALHHLMELRDAWKQIASPSSIQKQA